MVFAVRQSLPIDPFLPIIVEKLRKHPTLVIEASPGSGKTTRVPPALLGRGRVLVLEPRRLAAKYSALRVAEEMGTKIGDRVGYRFRFESAESKNTELLYLTEGMFLRRLAGDPDLRGVSTVILDEFHERNLETDAALAALGWIRTRRPELRVIAMSATLDAEPIAKFLGAERVVVEAPPFPLALDYLETRDLQRPLEDLVRRGVEKALGGEGDVLVFLAGRADIRRCEQALQPLVAKGIAILPLHGELDAAEQAKALTQGTQRKVVLATNVAETSLTIPGVRAVVDTGLFRQASFSAWNGMPQLRTKPITKAQADQRAGRAARTAPGRCFRLYTRGDYDARSNYPVPAIARSDLAQLWLDLKASGVADPKTLNWFEAPPEAQSNSAAQLLWRLGATESSDPAAPLNETGKAMARFPAHPRIARLCLAGAEVGAASAACLAAAALAEDEIDATDFLSALARFRPEGPTRRTYDQLRRAVSDSPDGKRDDATLTQALLAAFPDRVARKRGATGRGQERVVELVLAVGGQADAPEEALTARHEWFLALSVREAQHLHQKQSRVRAKCLVPIDEADLASVEPDGLQSHRDIAWNDARGRVVARETVRFGQLSLEESEKPVTPSQAVGALLLSAATRVSPGRWPQMSVAEIITAAGPFCEQDKFEEALARMEVAEGNAPTADDLRRAMETVASTRTSRAELEELDWSRELAMILAPKSAHRMDELCPREVALPSGRRAKIRYRLGQPPAVGSRLQDFFGAQTGPSIVQGRVKLVLELLAPNQRPLQVTRDLANFWKQMYPQVRKELMRKYPRHKWPEDPLKPLAKEETRR